MAVLSISRQFGAGGKYVSELLSERLNYDLADEMVVKKVAEEAGVADEWVKVTEREGEGLRKSFVTSLLSTRFIEGLLGESSPAIQSGQLFPYFQRIIPEIAKQDNVIFLGRGSQFILQKDHNTIKVLLVAPTEYRISFMKEHYNLTRDEARDAVAEWEENRVDFLRNIAVKDQDDPSFYDLVINTSVVRPVWAVNLIANLVAHRQGGSK